MDEANASRTPAGKPRALDTRANGLEPISQVYSINDKALGAGEPIRVRQGTRVFVHLLNASALENRTIALPGHEFQVLALDGNPVPTPGPAKVITLGPGERVDAYVEMSRPGVWILGATDETMRNAGLGVVIEYAQPTSRAAVGRAAGRVLGLHAVWWGRPRRGRREQRRARNPRPHARPCH